MIRVLRRTILTAGVLTLVGLLWLAFGLPIGVDRWLDVTEAAAPAAAIVVLGGGTTGTNLPLPQGWERLDVAARLHADGMAPVVILSGGGTARVSEAEIYANAAVWLGVPRAAIVFEPTARSTAEHGRALTGFTLPDGRAITTDTPLLVVTSTFHSRRALMSFSRAGFTRVRVVSRHSARTPARSGTPAALVSSVPTYQPSGKRYNDVLFALAYRSFDTFIGLREMGAIAVERVRGR